MVLVLVYAECHESGNGCVAERGIQKAFFAVMTARELSRITWSMSSAKTARATVEVIRLPNSPTRYQLVLGRTRAQNVVVFPRRRASVLKRTVSLRSASMPVPAASWTTSARTDPTRKLIHDFRSTVQELVYAVEHADRTAVTGLADSLDVYLLEALYGTKSVA